MLSNIIEFRAVIIFYFFFYITLSLLKYGLNRTSFREEVRVRNSRRSSPEYLGDITREGREKGTLSFAHAYISEVEINSRRLSPV